jgi:hypothetical protein
MNQENKSGINVKGRKEGNINTKTGRMRIDEQNGKDSRQKENIG